jgi:TPR repeat protein
MFTTLMQMGDTAMVRGDIMRARALYERAAAIHPAASAAPIAAGKTYDPNVLPSFGGHIGMADAAKAGEWYRRARDLGDPAAAALLAALR